MFILGRNSDLDFEVAKVLWGINPELYRWGIPFVFEDRNMAAMVNSEMAFLGDERSGRYETELANIVIGRGWESKPEWFGTSMLLCLLLPRDICKATVMACRGNVSEVIPSSIDKDHHKCHETSLNDSSEYKSKTT